MSFFGLMTVRAHEAVVEALTLQRDRSLIREQNEAETCGRLLVANRALRAERDAALAELAHWKQHGQLRDPATGRLIPKQKAIA